MGHKRCQVNKERKRKEKKREKPWLHTSETFDGPFALRWAKGSLSAGWNEKEQGKEIIDIKNQ